MQKKRLVEFQKLSNEIKLKYKKSLISSEIPVLFENSMNNKPKNYFGRDEFQNSVIINSRKNLIGLEKNIIVKKFNQQTIYGELIISDNLAA